MKKYGSIGLVFVLLLAFSQTAAAGEFGLSGSYWFPKMHASVQLDGGGQPGRDFDITDDLNVDDENYPVIQAFYRNGDHEIEAGYTYADYSGSTTLKQNSFYDGALFTAGTHVKFDLEYSNFNLLYGYRFYQSSGGMTSVYGFGELKYFDGKTRLRSAAQDRSGNFNAAIPIFGVDTHMNLASGKAEARIKAGFLPAGEDRAGDVDARLTWKPTERFDVFVGLRVLLLKIKDSDLRFNEGMAGPYIGFGLRF
ncbi:MAG: hypothetical protein KKB20_25930 [Proteobacteria bacterium]|nr:hypothetical protein [Pseudomonadota bacterium]